MKAFCVVLVVVAAILFWSLYLESPESASINEADIKTSAAAQPEEVVKYGPEVMVREVAGAVYERDFEVLSQFSSEDLRDHYKNPRDFERRVRNSLEDAPEVPEPGRGEVEVVGAAPENLFGEAVFYRVDVADGAGGRHVLYVVLREATEREALNNGSKEPEESADDAVYCYVFVENERTGEPYRDSAEAGLMRDLIGNSDTCVRKNDKQPGGTPGEKPSDKKPPGEKPEELPEILEDRGLKVVLTGATGGWSRRLRGLAISLTGKEQSGS